MTISHNDLIEALAAARPVVVVDVRERQEQATLYMGGINLPAARLTRAEYMDQLAPYAALQNVLFVCVCNHARGQRAPYAAGLLQTKGYNAVVLEGGMYAGWSKYQKKRTIPLPLIP